jgi:hypothetical protein
LIRNHRTSLLLGFGLALNGGLRLGGRFGFLARSASACVAHPWTLS